MKSQKLVFNKDAHFRKLSELAAKQEQRAEYREAAKTWNQASAFTLNKINYQWCKNRSEFCERVAERPFSKEEK